MRPLIPARFNMKPDNNLHNGYAGTTRFWFTRRFCL